MTRPVTDAVYHRVPSEPEPSGTSEELQLGDEQEISEEFVSREAAVSTDRRVQWIHFTLGCAVLLPWNAMLNAIPFFITRLEGSPFKNTFGSFLTTAFTIANFVFLAHGTATVKKASHERRGFISIVSLAVLVALLTLSTYLHVSSGLFFTFVLLNGVAQAAAGSYLQTSIVAVASLFGPIAMQSVMSGQAAVAVAISIVQLVSTYISVHASKSSSADRVTLTSEPEEQSAFMFFSISTLFLILSAAAQAWLFRLPAYKSIVSEFNHITHIAHEDSDNNLETSNLVSSSPTLSSDSKDGFAQVVRVAKTNSIFNIAVAYVFVITLAVYPSITLSIQSTNPSTHPLIFSAIHFLVMNTGDWIGRYMCSIPRLTIWSGKRLLVLSLSRTLFIPLFLICNVQRPSTETVHSSATISSDILYMLILLLFGVSNGWISSLCMMAAPSIQHNPRLKGRVEDVDVAATVASFCLIGGLAIGSFASFAVKSAICDCNPFRG